MNVIDDGTRRQPSFRRPAVRHRIAVPMMFLTTLAGCDSLLDVTLPGQLLDEDLNDPRLAETLVLGAQASFECAYSQHAQITAVWSEELLNQGTLNTRIQVERRSSFVRRYGSADCTSSDPPGIWLGLQISRSEADEALRRIEGFPEGSVLNTDYLFATARAYEGYSYQLLGEVFCELFFEAGARKTREEAFSLAEERFTSALDHASQVTSGADAADARSVYNMALVGRARARLHLGDHAGVLADAGQVDEGFVRNATYSDASSRRWNKLFEFGSVPEQDRDLEVDGVIDPRVTAVFTGEEATLRLLPIWTQQKYTARSSPIPFSSWREAQLMMAEVEGGQAAVDIINELRATVADLPWVTGDHDLPEFVSADPDEIREQVLEERRRELWLTGNRLGDMLRLGLPFPTGQNPRGHLYEDNTCIPTMEAEVVGNPNVS